MSYQSWLYARSCDSCQHGRDVHNCAGSVWIDGERVRCSCRCTMRDGTDSHAEDVRRFAAAPRDAERVVSDSAAPVNGIDVSTAMEDGHLIRGDE